MVTILLEPERKYTREEVGEHLELTDAQLQYAVKQKLIFFGGAKENYMYGVYLFQFMINVGDKLIEIKNGTYVEPVKIRD